MKKNTIYCMLAIVCMLGLSGCKKSVEDVAKWQSQGNAEKLIKTLSNNNESVRIAAAEALGDLQAQSAVEPLAKVLSDPNPQMALAAIEALASIGNPSVETHFITALKHEDRRVSIAAINGLGSLKSVRAIAPLAKALDDGDEQIACAAATALGRIGDEKAVEPLCAKLASHSYSLRLACIHSLGKTGGQDATAGLATALGDINKTIRQTAIESLVATGKPAEPHALGALRGNTRRGRSSAITVLSAIDAVPTEGSNLVWYLLAQAPSERDGIDTSVVSQLAKIDHTAEALLEAVAHNDAGIREHAFHAFETIGEPCAAQAAEAAEAYAGNRGKLWFKGRAVWAGAPSWRIDLWGAAVALNPNFNKTAGQLSTARARRTALSSPAESDISREDIPLLIIQLGDMAGSGTIDLFGADSKGTHTKESREKARQQLASAGNIAVFPLIAALGDDDQAIADSCAKILGEIGDQRAVPALVAILEKKIKEGDENLSHSPFYAALQQLDDPAAEPTLLKIRPNANQAIRVIERQYPEICITQTESHNAKAPAPQPIAFTLGYKKDGKEREVRAIFRKNENGDWFPTPPLPDELPL